LIAPARGATLGGMNARAGLLALGALAACSASRSEQPARARVNLGPDALVFAQCGGTGRGTVASVNVRTTVARATSIKVRLFPGFPRTP
jgi:hypothetical protein